MERGQRLMVASWSFVACVLWACSTPKVQAPTSTTKQSEKPATISDGTISTTNIAGDDGSVDSVGAFDKTVHPLTVKWCGACHGSAQSPLIGASDAKAAHDAIIATQKVDFDHTEKSRLILRMSVDKHNCPIDPGCDEAAKQMQTAIQTWADAIKAAAKVNSVAITSEPLHLSDAKATTVSGTNPSGVFAYYAANFTAKAPMVATTDKDSGNAVLNTPSGGKSVTAVDAASSDTTLGTATVTATISSAGTFNFYGFVNGPAADKASFYLKVDNGPLNPWLFKPNAGLYTWEVAANTVGGTPLALTLSAGTHTIEIRQREAGAQISRLVLSTVAKFDPSTAQATSRLAKLLRFDLAEESKIPGAALTIELEDYGTNAYLFRNPNLIVPSGSIHAKDLRLLINNTFLPQNATYTVVDKTLAAPGGALSTAAMIAVKDQGSDKDTFSVSFAAFEAK